MPYLIEKALYTKTPLYTFGSIFIAFLNSHYSGLSEDLYTSFLRQLT